MRNFLKNGVVTGLLTVSFAYAVNAQKSPSVTLKPLAGVIVTDGRIDEKEWLGATAFDMKGGGKIFFRHDGEYLYVGLRGTA